MRGEVLKEEDIYESEDYKNEMQQSEVINYNGRSKSPISNVNTNQTKI